MVAAGLKIALVLRAKAGSNILIQTHGIPGRAVQDATGEVAGTLAKFAAAGGRGNLDGSGDNPPGFSTGQLLAVQGRYCVTYRLVNAVYVMAVSEPRTNVFLCMQLLDAAAKLLVGVSKGVDVTPDRLAKRYTEVYTLLDDLLGGGGFAAMPPAFIHTPATSDRLMRLPTSAADAARRIKKIVRTGRGAAGSTQKAGAEAADPTPPPIPETPTQRDGIAAFAVAEASPLGGVSFDIPDGALPPPPARAAVPRRAPEVVAAPLPSRPPPAFKGAMEERAQQLENEGFGAFGEVEMLEAEKAAPAAEAAAAGEEDWATFAEEEATVALGTAAAAAAAAATAAAAAAAGPAITAEDVQDSLQLVEVWRGEAAGGRILRAGLEGTVRRKLAPWGLPAAVFRLLPAGAPVADACLHTASMNAKFAQRQAGPQGAEFLAAFQQASAGCTYLKYMLPAVGCAPPLQAQLYCLPGSSPASGGGWQALVVVAYAANPALPGSALEVSVEVDLPPEVATLERVSPAAQWSPQECRLRWMLPRVPPGGQGLLRAVVAAKPGVAGEAAHAALQQSASARLLCSGRPGRSLSGVGMLVGLPDGGSSAALPGSTQWFAELMVRP